MASSSIKVIPTYYLYKTNGFKMNRGYIYFALIVVSLIYLVYIYIPIIKQSRKIDKAEKSMNKYSQYQGRSFL